MKKTSKTGSFLPKSHGKEKQGKQVLKEPNTYFIKKSLVAVFQIIQCFPFLFIYFSLDSVFLFY